MLQQKRRSEQLKKISTLMVAWLRGRRKRGRDGIVAAWEKERGEIIFSF